ncbi:MAG: glycosyltransferase family 39 protein [Victivallales bacterium]
MQPTESKVKKHILIIIGLSLVLRIIAGYAVGNHFNPATWEYENLARSLLENGTFSIEYREYGEYKALLGPGYPFLTFLAYKVVGVNHTIMLFVQFLLMTSFSLAIYGIAYFFFKKTDIALIAGLLSVLHPGLLYYSSANLHEFNLYMPLFYGALLLCLVACRKGEWKYFILLGLIGGLAVFTRATIFPALILWMAFYALFPFEVGISKRFLKASTAIILIVAVNIPWMIRNYDQFNQFVFSQTNKWEAFWIGNNSNASGGQFKADGTAVLSCKGEEMQGRINASVNDEIAIENIFKDYAFKYVRENPSHFIKGLFRKGFYFWWFHPQTGLFYPRSYLIAYKILYSALLLMAAIGIYICHKRRLWSIEMLFPAILILGIWSVHTLNFNEMRHRWTVEPVLLIFASVAIFFLSGKIYQYWHGNNHSSGNPSIQPSVIPQDDNIK